MVEIRWASVDLQALQGAPEAQQAEVVGPPSTMVKVGEVAVVLEMVCLKLQKKVLLCDFGKLLEMIFY